MPRRRKAGASWNSGKHTKALSTERPEKREEAPARSPERTADPHTRAQFLTKRRRYRALGSGSEKQPGPDREPVGGGSGRLVRDERIAVGIVKCGEGLRHPRPRH